jgi:enoyl-CoA hydratase/carnithine racemase
MAVVDYDVRDGLAFIRLNRPERLNALNEEAVRTLRDVLFRFDDDPNAQVAILCGEGRAFCAGADVFDLQLRPPEEIERLGGVQPRDAQLRDVMFRFARWKPVVAAVHGYAIGGGLHLALLCDLVVAEASAQMQVAETAHGSDPSVLWSLIRARASESFATDVALTSRRWSGEEGFRAGVVSRVANDGEVLSAAEELATSIAANPEAAVRAAVKRRRAVTEGIEVRAHAHRDERLHLSEEYRRSAKDFAARRRTDDGRQQP